MKLLLRINLQRELSLYILRREITTIIELISNDNFEELKLQILDKKRCKKPLKKFLHDKFLSLCFEIVETHFC